jgi:hypothetical protein
MYNRRFYENGGDTMQPDSSGQGIMQAAPQDMQQGMQQPPLADQGQQPQIKDPNHALQIIIQMLIAQGIPPEQAKQIAMEMIKAVAEGGMQEMSDDKIHARFGGHITRQHYLFGGIGRTIGNIVGGVGKAVSGVVGGVVNAVKSVAKSDLGKAALAAAAIYASGGGFGASGFSFLGDAATGSAGLLGSGGQFGLGQSYLGQNLLGTSVSGMDLVDGGAKQGILGQLGITGGYGSGLGSGVLSNLIPGKSALTGAALGLGAGMLLGQQQQPTQNPGESNAAYQARVDAWKKTLNEGLTNPTLSSVNNPANLYPNNPFYAQRRAEGGRIGYEAGGIGSIIQQATREGFFGNNMLAAGGVPTGEVRQNTQGIHEIDYRKKGGFVPPIGVKEKADDIPAMLSNNEFVFTANAVRNAGHGNVNKGAKRMYHLMKHLEAGGVI